MTGILDEILISTRESVAKRAANVPLSALLRAASEQSATRDFASALREGPISVIAEIKRRSPSKGPLDLAVEPAQRAQQYEEAGAAAISVLTDAPFFGGSLEDLRTARAAVQLPVLRKDFMLDPYQVVEARAVGADAILVIMAAVDNELAHELIRAADELGMGVLVEVHSREELERAVEVGARIVGINNRDLGDFNVDLGTTEQLAPLVPDGCVIVAESGVRTHEDVQRVAAAGAHAVLVGESLMTSNDPAAALRSLRGVVA